MAGQEALTDETIAALLSNAEVVADIRALLANLDLPEGFDFDGLDANQKAALLRDLHGQIRSAGGG